MVTRVQKILKLKISPFVTVIVCCVVYTLIIISYNFTPNFIEVLKIKTFGEVKHSYLKEPKVIKTGIAGDEEILEGFGETTPSHNKPQSTFQNQSLSWDKFRLKIDPKCLHNWKNYQLPPEEDIEFLSTPEGKSYKKILAYHYAHGKHFGFGLGKKPFEASCCEEQRCFMTARRGQIPFKDFDAVIIHFRRFKFKTLPQTRSPHQRWIFFERESPLLSSKNLQQYEGIFNWTMSYRADADIYVSYGNVYPRTMIGMNVTSESSEASVNLHIETKTKLVAWLVSHCKTPSKREDYVRRLNKFINVDVYGKCGPFSCTKYDKHFCYKQLEQKYKFYLSFENSLCKDYVTEKFFNILRYNLVPVVRGSADYASIAPPHSYIDAKDFDSEKALADYLLYLDRNDTAYKEYFWWKPYFKVISTVDTITRGKGFCELCYKLHNDNETQIVNNLANWFIGKGICNKP